jgi:hypothetical protein
LRDSEHARRFAEERADELDKEREDAVAKAAEERNKAAEERKKAEDARKEADTAKKNEVAAKAEAKEERARAEALQVQILELRARFGLQESS